MRPWGRWRKRSRRHLREVAVNQCSWTIITYLVGCGQVRESEEEPKGLIKHVIYSVYGGALTPKRCSASDARGLLS